jgi:FAD/FMN-containing dehydrogenase
LITNFGGNVDFTPRHFYTPRTEQEVLETLDRHAHGKVRVVGALHSWSPAAVSADVLVDLRHFDLVSVERGSDGTMTATVGGGCRIKHLLRKLHALAGATMPSIGLITEQTIAGAIATGTHGAGKHSLSHYIEELRVAAYDPATGKARIYTWNDGSELRAARCAVGCLGIVLSVRFQCVPRYELAETMVPLATLDDVLAREHEFPLQQFYLIPHRWTYFAQRRAVPTNGRRRKAWAAGLYRMYWFLGIDIGLHLIIRLLVSVLRSPRITRLFFRHILAKTILKNRTVVDHDSKILVMEHELFRHLEIEIFVPAGQLRPAASFVRAILEVFDGASAVPSGEAVAALQSVGMYEELLEKRGTFTHHYPIAFRRVLPDDTLISMASGTEEPYYAISFITYARPYDRFTELASFLARSMIRLFHARLHWGKYFPLANADIESAYPHLAQFRELCCQVDPRGVFRNDFAERVLFSKTL